MHSIRGPNDQFTSTNECTLSPHVPIAGDGQENSAIMGTTSA